MHRKSTSRTSDVPPDLATLRAMLDQQVAEGIAFPAPEPREALRRVVEAGLSVDTVKELQEELQRLGVPRPSTYVESIATRASRSRRPTLTADEGEKLVRVASTLTRALAVWEDEQAAARFLTLPHPELGGATPIDRTLSEIGARQVEDLLLRLDLGLPV